MPTGTKEGYKAVFICHGTILSVGLQHLGLEYALKEWTVRPSRAYGPLTVFMAEEEARAFLKTMGPALYVGHKYALYKCRFAPSRKRVVHSPKVPGERVHLRDLPRGTAFAEMVMLTEQL
ncbi:MAG: hypothetical protein HY730_00235 [Candidatus Tectomicrobia bacterium]|uniref:Uncharacterized protein n=1 Tax=Tectimicrobiota bacterium TaxID=2528274 RepID=A0A933GK18_UNCTE|nr:hypothetical protein [Candidatus Tectomicrobia bacterium]